MCCSTGPGAVSEVCAGLRCASRSGRSLRKSLCSALSLKHLGCSQVQFTALPTSNHSACLLRPAGLSPARNSSPEEIQWNNSKERPLAEPGAVRSSSWWRWPPQGQLGCSIANYTILRNRFWGIWFLFYFLCHRLVSSLRRHTSHRQVSIV